MPSLSATDARFTSTFTVLEGGSGQFSGIINEPGQGEVPSFQFNLPRRLLRVHVELPLTAGMVIKANDGTVFMLGRHGVSEIAGFRNFRLFEADRQYPWQTRKKVIDPVTTLERDTELTAPTLIWGIYEPGQETLDRTIRVSFETGRFLTNRQVKRDDVIDGRKVSRVDPQLGIYLVALG